MLVRVVGLGRDRSLYEETWFELPDEIGRDLSGYVESGQASEALWGSLCETLVMLDRLEGGPQWNATGLLSGRMREALAAQCLRHFFTEHEFTPLLEETRGTEELSLAWGIGSFHRSEGES